jgi:serine/threonine-protein kinase
VCAGQGAEGLAAAHDADIVHRDLKPQNVMLTPDGRAKIVDFGVSKTAPTSHGAEDAAQDTHTLTAFDAIVGTVGYMSPEQVSSRPVDGRSDQFALGAIMYEMLTRKRAFNRGTAVQTMASIIEDEPAPLVWMCPDLPLSVMTIVERCLAKNPELRYASTRDLARDLKDALTEVLTNTRSLTGVRARLPARRSWMTVAAGIVSMVALIGAIPLQQASRAFNGAAAAAPAVPGARDAYLQGRGYLDRFDKIENIDRTIASFESAIAADGHYALARAALGEAYWRKYELARDPAWIDKAEESCREALTVDERLAPIHATLALIKRGRGRYEEAIASAERALELDSGSSAAFRELGRAYEATNRLIVAELKYKQAISAQPDDWLSFSTLGSFYLAQGRLPEAEAAFRRALELTPDNTRALNNLGATYFQMRRHEDAAATWEKSISVRPTPVASSNLGTYYYDHARYADSARNFQHAVDLSPADYRMWRNLAAALHWAPGQRARGRAAYQRAAALAEEARLVNPRQPDVLSHLADAYSMLGKSKEAREVASELEALPPSDNAVMFTMAGVYETIGDRERALSWLDKAIKSGYSRERIERSPFLSDLRKDVRYTQLSKTATP